MLYGGWLENVGENHGRRKLEKKKSIENRTKQPFVCLKLQQATRVSMISKQGAGRLNNKQTSSHLTIGDDCTL